MLLGCFVNYRSCTTWGKVWVIIEVLRYCVLYLVAKKWGGRSLPSLPYSYGPAQPQGLWLPHPKPCLTIQNLLPTALHSTHVQI